jgi:lipoate---protein ligase
LWRGALAEFEPFAKVHRGPMIRTRWSSDVCFAGTGPGEVMVDDAKLVGIAQRRTRTAVRFQTMVHLRWRPAVVAALVSDGPSVAEVASFARTCPAAAVDVTARLITALREV